MTKAARSFKILKQLTTTQCRKSKYSHEKPTLKSYICCDAFTEIPILPQIMTQGRFDLIKKFLYFVDNNTVSIYTGTKKN